jgi:hypothetical protein
MNKMSIVSVRNDIVYIDGKMIKAGKHPNGNAVQLGFDAVPDYAFAPQLPTVNQFRKIRVPSGNPRAPPKGTKVPVKFEQEGDDYQRPITDMFETTKLTPAVQKTANFSALLAEMIDNESAIADSSRPVPFNYNAGIKPGSRFLKIDDIAEPTGAMFRS